MTVGTSLVTLDGEHGRIRSGETNLGNLLADLLRAKFHTDIALINSGQIRDSIPAGPVTMEHVQKVLPFDSSTVTFFMTGQQLLQALENSASHAAWHGRPFSSGIGTHGHLRRVVATRLAGSRAIGGWATGG